MQFTYEHVDEFGNITDNNYVTSYVSKECCVVFGGTSVFDEEWSDPTNGPVELLNCGYFCCKTGKCGCAATCDWTLATTDLANLPIIAPYSSKFLIFQKPNGDQTSITPTGCSCIAGYTSPVSITDPNTGEVGTGCMLNDSGVQDLTGQPNIVYYTPYNSTTGKFEVEALDLTPGKFDTEPVPVPVVNYASWIEAVYASRENGIIPCDQYMNNGVNNDVEFIDASIYIKNERT